MWWQTWHLEPKHNSVVGFPGQPSSKCREMGQTFTCSLTAGSSSYIEENVGQQGAASACLCHPWTSVAMATSSCSVTLEVSSITHSLSTSLTLTDCVSVCCSVWQARRCNLDVQTRRLCSMWRVHHLSFISLWHTALISAPFVSVSPRRYPLSFLL